MFSDTFTPLCESEGVDDIDDGVGQEHEKNFFFVRGNIKMEQEHRRRKKVLWQARLRPERVITALHVWRRKEVAAFVCVLGVMKPVKAPWGHSSSPF